MELWLSVHNCCFILFQMENDNQLCGMFFFITDVLVSCFFLLALSGERVDGWFLINSSPPRDEHIDHLWNI